MLPQEIFLTLQLLRLFLVASEHSDGEKPVSDIPPFCLTGNVFPNTRSAKLHIVCRLNMSKTAVLDTFTIYMYMYCTYGWWLFSRGGGQPASKRGRVPLPPPPLNETLLMLFVQVSVVMT